MVVWLGNWVERSFASADAQSLAPSEAAVKARVLTSRLHRGEDKGLSQVSNPWDFKNMYCGIIISPSPYSARTVIAAWAYKLDQFSSVQSLSHV